MCGIAGFIGRGNREDLERIVAGLSHRGPDDRGFWIDEANAVFLGHARLSILDLACGHQPMISSDGRRVIVFNGEVYNFAELRQELEAAGRIFQTSHSDTEVLLEGYAHWGAALLPKLNGMWAFAIYDLDRREVFFARDRFGKKPFYYYDGPELFAWASELKALCRHRNVQATLDPVSLQKYFGYGYIPAPRSAYREIKKLPAGCWMRLPLGGRPEIHEYWSYRIEPDTSIAPNVDAAAERLNELLRAATKRRLIADVPAGVFLSGGIDSSLVTAIAAEEISIKPISSFSIGFEEKSFDESEYARFAAKHFGTQHFEEILSIEAAREVLPQIVSKLDEPMGDSSLLPTWLVCRLAARHVKVVLGGDGADELFAGYDPFKAIDLSRKYQSLVPRPVHQAVSLLASRLPVSHQNMSLDFKIKRTLRGLSHPPALWCPVWMSPLSAGELSELFAQPLSAEEIFSEAIEWWDSARSADLHDRVMEFYVRFYLQDDILTKVDRASMMHGLEARSPFLDIELVDFVRKLPATWKFQGGTTKVVLKKAAEKILPAEIIHRKKKGFGVPVGAWFRSGSLALGHESVPGLSQAAVQQFNGQHLSGAADQRLFLWNYWLLQRWLSEGA